MNSVWLWIWIHCLYALHDYLRMENIEELLIMLFVQDFMALGMMLPGMIAGWLQIGLRIIFYFGNDLCYTNLGYYTIYENR